MTSFKASKQPLLRAFLLLCLGTFPLFAEQESGTNSFEAMKKKMEMSKDVKPAVKEKPCVASSGYSLGGFDPVSYFEKSGPVQGVQQHKLTVDGSTYTFASHEHLEKFKKNPELYLPQFGGYCAMSLALGIPNCPDYDNFIVDENNRLLLFETTAFTNGRVLWEQSPQKNYKKAQTNFKKFRSSVTTN